MKNFVILLVDKEKHYLRNFLWYRKTFFRKQPLQKTLCPITNSVQLELVLGDRLLLARSQIVPGTHTGLTITLQPLTCKLHSWSNFQLSSDLIGPCSKKVEVLYLLSYFWDVFPRSKSSITMKHLIYTLRCETFYLPKWH